MTWFIITVVLLVAFLTWAGWARRRHSSSDDPSFRGRGHPGWGGPPHN